MSNESNITKSKTQLSNVASCPKDCNSDGLKNSSAHSFNLKDDNERNPAVSVTVPGHITGFFAARRHEDPIKAGSVGCGLNLQFGATTTVKKADDTVIYLNGKLSAAPVTRHVIDRLAKSPVEVQTNLQMQMGTGFGASGAGALGCAYALNRLFDLGLTCNQAAAVAHVADVTNGTGLGDVIAQNTGGLVIRLSPGAPGTGIIDRIPVPALEIHCIIKGPISTKEVLSDQKVMKEVNRYGETCLKELIKRPTFENFMDLSARFTRFTGLARPWMLDAMEAVKSAGGMASMIMLGDAIFCVGDECLNALLEFGPVITTRLSFGGVHID